MSAPVHSDEVRQLIGECAPLMSWVNDLGQRVFDLYPETQDRWLDDDSVDLRNAADALMRRLKSIEDRLTRIEAKQ